MAKKSKKQAKNSNDITQIVDSEVVDQVVAEILTTSKDEKRDKFILLWLLGHNMKAAALSAGYSQSYSESGVQKAMRDSSNLRERIEQITSVMPEKYKSLCRLRLGDVAEIEGKALKLMKDSPDKAIRSPQLLRQLKIGAGVIGDDAVPVQPAINIGAIQIYLAKQLEAGLGDTIDVTPQLQGTEEKEDES